MFRHINWQLAELAIVAAGISLGFTACARVLARRIGLLDRPDNVRKSHAHPTPLMGGVAIYGALLTTLALGRFLGNPWMFGSDDTEGFVSIVLLSAGLFCLVGLWDDWKALRPRTKLLFQILASLPFVIWGRTVQNVQLMGVWMDLGLFGAIFTIFWLVACTNIINLVDGLDGLAGTIGLIVCLAIAMLSDMRDLQASTSLALIFSGCLLGFLLHNWPPAKIFLGDSGSLMIGFVIGALSIESSLKTATTFALAVPLVLVSVPIFDTAMAIVRRRLSGKGIGEPDRAHIHHCFQDRGLSRGQSLIAISGLCVAMAAATLLSAYVQNDLLALGVCVSLLVLLVIGRFFGYNETVLFFRFTQAVSLMLVESSGILRTRIRMARLIRGELTKQHDSWNVVKRRVRRMGGLRLEFVAWNEQTDEVATRLEWNAKSPLRPEQPVWQLSYSLPDKDGMRASVIASGHSRKKLDGHLMLDLYIVFDAFCRNWSNDEDARLSMVEAPATIPLSPHSLRIVPGTSEVEHKPVTEPLRDRRVA